VRHPFSHVINMPHPDESPHSPNDESVRFRGWRLLGVIMAVVVVLALIAAAVDIIVIGPLEGRI